MPDYEQAIEQGYLGNVPPEPPNSAYTLEGQGADAAQAEREALRANRDAAQDASSEATA